MATWMKFFMTIFYLLQMDPKFLKNMKFAKKHNLNKHQQEKRAAANKA